MSTVQLCVYSSAAGEPANGGPSSVKFWSCLLEIESIKGL